MTRSFIGNTFQRLLALCYNQSLWESWFCSPYISFPASRGPRHSRQDCFSRVCITLKRIWETNLIPPTPTLFSKRQMPNASGHPKAKAQRSAYVIRNKQKHHGHYKGDYPRRDHAFRIMQKRRRLILERSHTRHFNEAAMRKNTASSNELNFLCKALLGNDLPSH